MAHVKAGGTAKGNKDSHGKRLGVKIYGGQIAQAGNIIVRQRGTKVHAGSNVRVGKDHTLYAMVKGKVTFGKRLGKSTVSVVPMK